MKKSLIANPIFHTDFNYPISSCGQHAKHLKKNNQALRSMDFFF